VNVEPQREQVAQEPDEERHAEVRQVEVQDGVGQGEEQRFRHQLRHQPPAARPERAGRVEPVPGDPDPRRGRLPRRLGVAYDYPGRSYRATMPRKEVSP
jgi:hypothetical protein